MYSFHLCADTAPANPFVKCSGGGGFRLEECERCQRWRCLGIVIISVAMVAMLVVYFGGKRVVGREGEEEEGGKKRREDEEEYEERS